MKKGLFFFILFTISLLLFFPACSKKTGQYKWRDTYNLEFTPGINALQWGQRLQISITKAVPIKGEAHALRGTWSRSVRVKYFQVAGKVASWPVIPGYPRFIQAITSYTDDVGSGPVLLLYDQPVEGEKITPHIRVTDKNDVDIPFTVSRPKILDYIFDDGDVPDEIQGLYLSGLPENGEYVYFEVPEWYHPESETESGVPGLNIHQFKLRVNKIFKVFDIDTPGQRKNIFPLKSKIYLSPYPTPLI